jgi:hypothetical protein
MHLAVSIKPGSAAQCVVVGWRPGNEEGNEEGHYDRGRPAREPR